MVDPDESSPSAPGFSIDIGMMAAGLQTAAVEAIPSWLRRSVLSVVAAQELELPDDFDEIIDEAAERATRFVESRLGELLGADIDRQQSTPLTILRDAARFPVEVLHRLGATQVHRLDMERWAFPNDPFALTPAALSEFGNDVHEAGMIWGAAKAGLHLQRRKAEGLA